MREGLTGRSAALRRQPQSSGEPGPGGGASRRSFRRFGSSTPGDSPDVPAPESPQLPEAPEAFVSADSAASVTLDAGWRILTWGKDAEEFFGHAHSAARGMVLHDILKTRDLAGNPVACFCGMLHALRLGEPAKPQVVEVTTASGARLRVVVYVDPTTPPEHSRGLLFRFRPDSRRRQADRRGLEPTGSPHPNGVVWGPQRARTANLSPAELNVLRLLAAGKRADEVAETLCNSVLTVRNHIQRILRKLGARSQAQAISVALRSGLV